MTAAIDQRPHALYRFYDHGGALLYIGITVDIPARMKKHRAEKEWWTEVARIAVENHPTRETVLAAEQRAIVAEQPRWNIQHAQPQPTGKRGAATHSDRIRAVCMGCRKPVTGEDGVVHVLMKDVHDVEKAWKDIEKERDAKRAANNGFLLLTVAELRLHEGPRRAQWQVHCDACNPHESDPGTYCHGCYWFSVGRVQTWAALVEWTAHLSEKGWLKHTNWFNFIRNTANGWEKAGLVADSTDEGRSRP